MLIGTSDPPHWLATGGSSSAEGRAFPVPRSMVRAAGLRGAGRDRLVDDDGVLDPVIVRGCADRTGKPQPEQTKLAQRIGIRLKARIDRLTTAWTAKSQQSHVWNFPLSASPSPNQYVRPDR